MNTTSKKVTGILSVFIALFSFMHVSAQDKPKGKPWAAPESAVKMKNPVKADESNLKEGKDIFAQQCKSCHGVKGKGDGPKAEKLEISCGDFTSPELMKQTDGELFWKTTEGRKPMPSFKEKLSDNERWTVINYVRSLGKAK
jgi:mono/diheme cytochrome c family protein